MARKIFRKIERTPAQIAAAMGTGKVDPNDPMRDWSPGSANYKARMAQRERARIKNAADYAPGGWRTPEAKARRVAEMKRQWGEDYYNWRIGGGYGAYKGPNPSPQTPTKAPMADALKQVRPKVPWDQRPQNERLRSPTGGNPRDQSGGQLQSNISAQRAPDGGKTNWTPPGMGRFGGGGSSPGGRPPVGGGGLGGGGTIGGGRSGGVTTGPGGGDPNYWTRDRMRNAWPMGMGRGGGGVSPPGGVPVGPGGGSGYSVPGSPGGGGGQTNWMPPGMGRFGGGGSSPGGMPPQGGYLQGPPKQGQDDWNLGGGVTTGGGGGDPGYWTPERMRNARPMGMGNFGGGSSPGGMPPQGGYLQGPPKQGQDDWNLGGGVTTGGGGGDPGYWTPERMRNARPMGMGNFGGGGSSPGGMPPYSGGGQTNWMPPQGGGFDALQGGQMDWLSSLANLFQGGGQTNWMPPGMGNFGGGGSSPGGMPPYGGGGQTNWMPPYSNNPFDAWQGGQQGGQQQGGNEMLMALLRLLFGGG